MISNFKKGKKNLSLALAAIMAVGVVMPTATFAEQPKDNTPSTEQAQPEKKDGETTTPEKKDGETTTPDKKDQEPGKDTKTEPKEDAALTEAKAKLDAEVKRAEGALKAPVIAADAKEVKEGDKFHTQAQVDALKAALTKAKADKETAKTIEEVNAVTTTLKEANDKFEKEALVGTKKVETPKTLEEQIKALKAERDALKAQLKEANADKATLNKKIDELNKRIAELEAQKGVKVNKLFLERVTGTLSTVKKNDLVKADAERFAKLLPEAKALLAKKDATQKEVDEMAAKVLDFLYTAKYEDSVADTRELKKVIEKAKKVNERDLARRDYTDLQKLIKDADKVLADRKSSQKDVDAATKDLDNFLLDIVSYKVDTKDLSKLVKDAEKLDLDKFNRRDRYEFEDSLNKAKDILRDPGATQREIDKAYDNLHGLLKDIAKDGRSDVSKDILKMLNGADYDVDVEKALNKIKGLFNLPVVETRTLDANAKLSTLKYVFTINSQRFAEVSNKAINVYQLDTAPFISNDRTMVPLRYAAYTLQADVSWDQATRTATFTKNGVSAKLTIGSNLVQMSNGKNFNMDQAPIIRNNRMHVSISNVAKIFGETSGTINDGQNNRIEWDAQNKAVIVYVAK